VATTGLQALQRLCSQPKTATPGAQGKEWVLLERQVTKRSPLNATTAKDYGQPIAQVEAIDGFLGVKGRAFRVSTITVTAYLLDKTCEYEQYSKPGGLTDREILQILAANSGGHEWAALDKPAGWP
jgi:hypothetical protein